MVSLLGDKCLEQNHRIASRIGMFAAVWFDARRREDNPKFIGSYDQTHFPAKQQHLIRLQEKPWMGLMKTPLLECAADQT